MGLAWGLVSVVLHCLSDISRMSMGKIQMRMPIFDTHISEKFVLVSDVMGLIELSCFNFLTKFYVF